MHFVPLPLIAIGLATAFTVTVNAPAAAWFVGVPVLPVGEPGLAVSPGKSTWSWL